MIGKITYALTRQEADTYRSQGLPREARDLYRKLRSCSPNLSPELRADIAIQLRQIELEIGSDCIEECRALSDNQIAIIKKGWSDQATLEEMCTCALEFLLQRSEIAFAHLPAVWVPKRRPRSRRMPVGGSPP
jgi:hypothetical protein